MNFNEDLFASLSKSNDLVTTFADSEDALVKDWLPTLIPGMDAVMLGGFPLSGRVTEMYGEPSVGKSTFVAKAIAVAQQLGVIPIMFDIEGTTSRDRLEELGVDPEHILKLNPKRDKHTGIVEPITIEDVFQTIVEMASSIHSKEPDQQLLFIWDTVAMTQPRMVAEQEIGQQAVGQQARALSEGIRKVNANLLANNASLIALNQARADIGGNAFLHEVKTIGGNAWQHEMSLRLFMSRGKRIQPTTTDKTEIGHWVYLKFAKSKIGDNAGKKAIGALLQQNGFDLNYNVYSEAKDAGLITGTQYRTYTTKKGTEIKLRDREWPDYLAKRVDSSDKDHDMAGAVFLELWQSLIKDAFPNCYPPLFNVSATLTEDEFPFIKGLREYYIKIQDKLPTEAQHTNYKLWKEANPSKKG